MQSSPDERPNILLVVLDSVRASNTSLHRHDNETTPFLEQFADEATWYTQARSPGTESLSSHTSIFTGLDVREHGITDRRQRLEPGHTVWERLSDDGYETGVFSNNPFLTELPVGLDGTFDHVCGRRQEQPYPDAVNPKNFVIDAADRGPRKYVDFVREAVDNGRVAESLLNGLSFKLDGSHEKLLPASLEPDSSAEQYADQFLAWQRDREGPWAACVNFMDAHYPYEPGPEHDRWGGDELRRIQRQIEDQAWEFVAGDRPWGERHAIEALYDGAIRRMDAAVERIVSGLREADELEETMIVVT
ncbi:MAG TPA: sulfatase-like hydrolase/transferase, partial [Natronoarchaeum rubrum]|nr:sulfatase-like hydrolase/transferase [Natronoarchaeum rubrum]